MIQELVSICIPAYNNERVIGRTIESILKQTYTNIEVVVVDDASKDSTPQIVKDFNDERVRLIENDINLGMSGNWNKCVSETRGNYVKLICADDILEPECIWKEMECFDKFTDIVMTINDSFLIDDNDNHQGIFPRYYRKGIIDGEKLAHKSLVMNNFFGMPSAVLFKKEAFVKSGGFDVSYKYILDFDLWIRMARMGMVYVIDGCYNSFRLRNDSNTGNVFTNDSKTYYEEHKYLLNKYKDEFKLSKIEIDISKFSRRVRNMTYHYYLQYVLRKAKRNSNK